MKTTKEIRKYLGLALIPQAGVAIGLAFLGQRMLPVETGKLMLTIILSSSVLYEMVGPISAKGALFLSGSISNGENIGIENSGIEIGREMLYQGRKLEEITETTNYQEENIAVLAGLKGYDEGVDERDDVNAEHEVTGIKEVKKKKKKK